jgi:hypothetical protein
LFIIGQLFNHFIELLLRPTPSDGLVGKNSANKRLEEVFVNFESKASSDHDGLNVNEIPFIGEVTCAAAKQPISNGGTN